jgi:hypothetical protein
MGTTGIILGITLLVVVTGVALFLGRQANRGVRQFREEHHESFLGRRQP